MIYHVPGHNRFIYTSHTFPMDFVTVCSPYNVVGIFVRLIGVYFRFHFRTLSGTWFGTVWDAFGCVLGVPSRRKSSDFVKDIVKKHSFAHDHLPEPFLKLPGKASGTIWGAPWERSWSFLGSFFSKACLTFGHTLPSFTLG